MNFLSQLKPMGFPAVVCLASLCFSGSTFAQAEPAKEPSKPNPLDLSQGEAPEDFFDALASGTVKLNVRTRASYADIRGTTPSEAYTIRTRLGYLTQKFNGFQGYIEMEDISSFDDDRYNAAGLNGQPGRSVIADVEVTELNQAWAKYELPLEELKFDVKVGRQVIALDDQRFIGHVGWRQDNQTFDAITLSSDFGIEGLKATYGYLWKINRIFGDQRDWDSESHVVNVSYDIANIGKITGFGYFLDFDGDSPANSNQTFGVRLAGKQTINDTMGLNYQASIAYQEDYADNAVDYDAMYYMVDAGVSVKDVGVFGAGFEVLGSDDGNFAFRTPLATGHKFNGFADVFLVTPNDGLQDFYIYYKNTNLPLDLKGMLSYHYFGGDDSIDKIGEEINAVLSRKINDNLTVSGKFAYFISGEPGFAERSRLTVDLTLAF